MSLNLNNVEMPEGDFLSTPGKYDVKILSYSHKDIGSGFVEYECKTVSTGQKCKLSLSKSPKAMFRTVLLAKACGLTEEQMGNFDYGDLVRKTVGVTFVPDGKYLKDKAFAVAEGDSSGDSGSVQYDDEYEDDLPF